MAFRFIHATDLHFDSYERAANADSFRRLDCLIDDINVLEKSIDFVIFSGDITDRGAASENELKEVKAFLDDRLLVPYHVVAGNHDLAPSRRFAAMYPGKEDYHEGNLESSHFVRVFGEKGIRFSFEHQGYTFIGFSLRNGDPDGVLDWVEKELERAREPVIVISHYGVYPPRDGGPLFSWGFSRIEKSLPRVKHILSSFERKIVLYLYGHNHVNSLVRHGKIFHSSGGGIQKGCTGYRVFTCDDEVIEASFRFLSDKKLWNFDYWGGEHPERCRDSTHLSVRDYHRGAGRELYSLLSVRERKFERISGKNNTIFENY